MNDLEERLRAALDARAGTYEAGPDAWMGVQRRLRRSPGTRRAWLVAVAAVAAIALLVPFLLTRGLNKQPAETPDEVYRRAMDGRTPYGEELTLANPTEGKPLRLWFAKNAQGAPETCSLVEQQAGPPSGGCHLPENIPASYNPAWYEGTTAREGSDVVMDYGVATDLATGVSALAKDGRRIEGTIHRPAGAPMGFWSVTFSTADEVAKLEFTGPTLDKPVVYERTRLFFGRPGASLGEGFTMPGGFVATPHTDKDGPILLWTRGGREVSRQTLDPKFLFADTPVAFDDREGSLQGLVRKDIATLELITAKGTLTAETVQEPWNYGIRLFSVPFSGRIDWNAGVTEIAYDDTGKEVWRRVLPPSEGSSFLKERVGEVLTVPGTDDFPEGPARIWFIGEGRNTMLCSTGGLGPTGERQGGCANASVDPNGFSYDTLRSYLPEPGRIVAFGALKAGWRSAAAVTPDGTRIPATVHRVDGAPYPIWTVTYPRDLDVAAFVFANKGSQVENVYLLDAADCWDAEPPATGGQALPHGVTAYLRQDKHCLQWVKGKDDQTFDRLPGAKLSSLVGEGRPVRWSSFKGVWYGFATAETARVVGEMGNGTRFSADTVPDTWGEGVAMFAGPLPDKASPPAEIIGYARDGSELWRYDPKEYQGG
ncbi:hypothetical protein ACIBG8_32715 [Nonomuraea sp. NPDC050556]|uniref:hypothetical protein n=1 Tax=Nonomuraea sp. NPDC050556 TaxID=3364369 RepID=UPI0037AAB494